MWVSTRDPKTRKNPDNSDGKGPTCVRSMSPALPVVEIRIHDSLIDDSRRSARILSSKSDIFLLSICIPTLDRNHPRRDKHNAKR